MKSIYNKLTLVLVLCLLNSVVHSQLIGKGEYGTFALENADIYTVSNGVMKASTLLIKDGKIAGVGNVAIPADAKQIDCSGKRIYPGFIDSGTKLGLNEIGSISLTRDASETGNFTPQAKALTAINPNSVLIPVTRVSGVTTSLAVPSSSLFPGTAALIDLWGYTPKQMDAGFQGLVVNFPRTGKRGRWDRRSAEDIAKDAKKAIKKLSDFWQKAVDYAALYDKNNGSVLYNPELESMRLTAQGKSTALVRCNSKNDILEALKWIKKNKIKAVLTGVKEGYLVADSIAQANIPVITGPILSIPKSSDGYDLSYKNAGILTKAGVKVAIQTDETENVRNLPYNAGFAAAYGMGTEEALKAITINAAEIFGLQDNYGSIEKGKVANVFICDGDPFETKTTVEQVFIRGCKIPMESRHTLLYDEFLERNPGLAK